VDFPKRFRVADQELNLKNSKRHPTKRRKPPLATVSVNGLLPEEHQDIRSDIDELVDDPAKWLDEPNDQLGGKKPSELIGTDREQRLRDLLRAIKYGIPT
jgi:hypothetical protein